MKINYFAIIIVFLITGSFLFCQSKQKKPPSYGTIAGKITEGKSDMPLIGAAVVVRGTNSGTTTDNLGEYKIEIQKGTYVLWITHIGYRRLNTDSIKVNPNQKTILDFQLSADTLGSSLDPCRAEKK